MIKNIHKNNQWIKNTGQLIFPLILLAIFVFPFNNGYTQGVIIPERQPDLAQSSPFVLKNQNIQAEVVNQVADYEIQQTFQNQSERQIEGIFYFPLPKGSQITDFTYVVNGKEMKGEILEKDKAREAYREIVRKMRDPALLEFMNQDLFRASIFPVAARNECSINLKFAQVLSRRDQFYSLEYPLFQKRLGRNIKPYSQEADLSVYVKLKGEQGIQHIYSPSHDVEVLRKDKKNAVVSFEGEMKNVASNRFRLFYELGSDEVGLSLLSHRRLDEDGYFMLIASPAFNPDIGNELPKDVLFVLDISGSMSGEKIKQAKKALRYCLSQLEENDRFNIIPFSTEPKPFRETLQPTNQVLDAKSFVEALDAKGGTNIHEALTYALQQNQSPDRLFTVIFLTDGLPTVGVTNEKEILKAVMDTNQNNIRIFSFGIGYDVNTFLIDQLANRTNALAEYIKPKENIEVIVSSFYEKIASPVLTQISLQWNNLSVEEVYPREMPDLFKGGEMIVLGRYPEPGEGDIVLSGKRGEESFQYAAEVELASSNKQYDFIPTLWASRKIGYLLNEIRLHGDDQELVDEVIRLSKQYGIVTPYTSYLAQEDQPAIAHTIPGQPHRPPHFRRPSQRQAPAYLQYDAAGGITGKKAVESSEQVLSLMSAKSLQYHESGLVRHIADREFTYQEGKWKESNTTNNLPALKIQYGSEAYFNLLDLYPELTKILTLGDQISFTFAGHHVIIGEEGKKELSKKDLQRKLKTAK